MNHAKIKAALYQSTTKEMATLRKLKRTSSRLFHATCTCCSRSVCSNVVAHGAEPHVAQVCSLDAHKIAPLEDVRFVLMYGHEEKTRAF